MPKEKKISYFINLIGILLLFLALCFVFDGNILGNKTSYINGIVIMCMITVIMVCSLNLITGFMGEFSLGHAGFMSIGAYAASVTTIAINNAGIVLPKLVLFLIAILVGGIATAICGVLFGVPALRLRGDYLAIVTIAVAEIVRVAFTNFQITGGGKTLSGISKVSDFHYVYITAVVSVIIMYMYIRSRFGRVVTAIREDYIAASASGINITYYKVLTFAMSAFFAGVAGAAYAHYITSLIPTKFSFMYSSEILTMVILGGSGSFTGSIIGGSILSALPEALRSFQSYRMLMYSIVLVLVMIFKPSGLFGTYEFSLTRVLKKIFVRKSKGGSTHE